MILAFDPGATTGWCSFNDEGDTIEFGQLSLDELADKVEEWVSDHDNAYITIHTVVYETFKLFRHKAKRQSGSDMPASQAIGIIKTLIRRLDSPTVITQDPSIKSIAQKWTQMNPPANHSQSHWVDAFNHGAYYLINEGVRKTYLQMEQDKKNGM